MSIVRAVQNGSTKTLPTNANVNINLGNGNSVIKVTAKNANIDTGCGDQDITAIVSNDLSIDTGFCGEDKINAVVGGNASITTREDNDYINLYVNGNFNVSSGMNHPSCGAEEDNDTVLIHGNLNNTDGKNYVSTGEGTDNVRIIANNVDVNKGDGNLVLGFYGDNYNVNSDADNNKIGFWSDNTNITITGNGKQDIQTLDFSFEKGEFTDFGFEKLLAQDTYRETTVDVDVKEAFTGKTNIDEVSAEYGLPAEQTAKLKTLDLTKKLDTGHSYYVLYKDKNSDTYEIGYRDGYNRIYNEETGEEVTWAEAQQTSSTYSTTKKKWYGKKTTTYYQVVTTNINSGQYKNEKAVDVQGEKEIKTTTTTTDHYDIDGVKNVNINLLGNSNHNIELTASEGNIGITAQNALNDDKNYCTVRSGYELKDSKVDVKYDYVMENLNLTAGDIVENKYSTSQTTQIGKKTSWSGWAKVVAAVVAGPLVLDAALTGGAIAVATGGALIPLATTTFDAATLSALNLKALAPIV